APVAAVLLLVAFATQATGSVRLQVTGRPPTCNGPGFSGAQERIPIGKALATTPCSSRLRCSRCVVNFCVGLIPKLFSVRVGHESSESGRATANPLFTDSSSLR